MEQEVMFLEQEKPTNLVQTLSILVQFSADLALMAELFFFSMHIKVFLIQFSRSQQALLFSFFAGLQG